jgi:hypothetical protein
MKHGPARRRVGLGHAAPEIEAVAAAVIEAMAAAFAVAAAIEAAVMGRTTNFPFFNQAILMSRTNSLNS